MFVALPQRQVSLVEQLGLDQTEKGFVSVDKDQGTSLPMLWAAGDLTSHRQQVVEAAAQGARAATAINAVLTLPSQGSPHG
jgi:thioredoxin reductase